MKRFHPSPALVISLIALFLALGGTSYAAITSLPANSVGAKQLKKNAVTSVKIANGAVTAAKINPNGLTVPEATLAAHAANADNATQADNATNATSATDAAQLGGVAASGYQRATLPSGQTESGVFSAWAQPNASGEYFADGVTFPVRLAADIAASNTIFISYPATSATHCPGAGQADAGYLCLYEKYKGNGNKQDIFNPTTAVSGSSKLGFVVYYSSSTGGSAWSYGTWAVTAP